MLAFLLRVRDGIMAVGRWLWSRPVVLAGLIGSLVGGFFVLRSKKNQIDNLKDAVEVQRAKQRIARAEAKAEALEASADDTAEEVRDLKRDVLRSKQRAAELAHGRNLEGVPDEEIARLFTDAGL